MNCNPFYNPYSEEEKRLVRSAWADNLSDEETCGLLKQAGFDRTIASIKTQRCRLKLVRERIWTGRKDTQYAETTNVLTAAEKRVNTDLAFKRAMLAAIKSGAESAVIGVVKDRRPFALSTIRAEPARSICGSSSAQCAEAP